MVINEERATANDLSRRDIDFWNTIINIHLNETHMHISPENNTMTLSGPGWEGGD